MKSLYGPFYSRHIVLQNHETGPGKDFQGPTFVAKPGFIAHLDHPPSIRSTSKKHTNTIRITKFYISYLGQLDRLR